MANILLGVTGSIAAYKIIELTHGLKKSGHQVKIILTKDALQFVTPLSFSAFNADVYIDEINPYLGGSVMQHINLARWPDIIVICPLSANTCSKIVAGFADNLLTSTILATTKPVYMVPAMNMYMWQNLIVRKNFAKLQQVGYTVWGPDSGLQACGDNGDGRMIEADEIAANITHALLCTANKALINKKVVITAGATLEAIDPVRYLSNHSSGKMGYALARAFAAYGAEVILVSGNSNLAAPNSVTRLLRVSSCQEMLEASLNSCVNADIFIGCAAVSDYTIQNYSQHKIKKQSSMQLELVKNPDIIANIKLKFPHLYVIGFAAETQKLHEYAKQKISTKNLDMIVANDVSGDLVFGKDANQVILIDKALNMTEALSGSKDYIAHEIIKFMLLQYNNFQG